jgi:DNA-binding transcriptional regulator/RsmH inhibitor MraZ
MTAEQDPYPELQVDFFGSCTMTVDRTQRVAIPSKFMEALKTNFPEHHSSLRVFLTSSRDEIPPNSTMKPVPFLQIFPIPVFRFFMRNAFRDGVEARILHRKFEEVEIDADRRIRLTSRLMDYLGIDPKDKNGGNEVVFQGNTETILLYSARDYKILEEAENDEVERRFKASARTGAYAYGRSGR